MTDAEFYDRLDRLVEEAERGGLSRALIIEDLRLLAESLDQEDRDR
jgi:hypothetical protein